MSWKTQASIVVLILASLAGAFYLLRSHAELPASASAPGESGPPELPPPDTASATAAVANPPSAESHDKAKSASANAPASAGSSSAISPSLHAGETLDYSATVARMSNVANLRLQVVAPSTVAGESTWHLQAIAHTENPLRMVFELDDQFDSYSSAKTLASVQYEMYLNERGQKVTSIQRMTTTGNEPAPAGMTEVRILPGTRDPLGLLQYLRTIDWSQKKDASSLAYDGHRLYDVKAQLLSPTESVDVPAGKYTASKIGVHVFENGAEIKDAQFTLYLANNADRTPVRLDAVLPFANAQVALISAK